MAGKAHSSASVSAIPRRRAIGSASISHHVDTATEIVDVTLGVLGEPDAEMLEAGAFELAHAFAPRSHTKAQLRALASVVWMAMLHRART